MITLLNAGEIPLSNFMIFLNSKKIEPYYVSEIAYPKKEIRIILSPEQAGEWQRTEGIVLILADGTKFQIKAGKAPATGNFVYVASALSRPA